METEQNGSGLKKALILAKEDNRFIRLLFFYPGAIRKTIKSGHVREIYDDSFDFDESFDGHVTYSYKFLVSVINPKIEASRPNQAESPNSQINKRGKDGAKL